MQMDMIGNPRPRSLSLIDPDIESVWIPQLLRNLDRGRRQVHQFLALVYRNGWKAASVITWDHHQVTTVVRVAIEHHEALASTVHDQVVEILRRAVPAVTKQACLANAEASVIAG